MLGGASTLVVLAGCEATSASGDGNAHSDPGVSPGATPSEVASLGDVPVGGSIAATLDGAPILISQPTAGSVVAFSAICTHQGCVVKPGKGEFDCPCHGSRYNSTTGEVLSGPAPKSLGKVPVTIAGDAILAG
jgi:Rieske Fe-S protein